MGAFRKNCVFFWDFDWLIMSLENRTAEKLRPNIFEQFAHLSFLSVLIEIPGWIFSIFVIDCWGLKPVLSLCQVTKS